MMTVRLAAALADLNDPYTRPAVLCLKIVRPDCGIRRG
jgi:hypothetical protein